MVCGNSPADPCDEIEIGNAHGKEAKPCPKVHFAIQEPPKRGEERRPVPACMERHRIDREILEFGDESVSVFPDKRDIILSCRERGSVEIVGHKVLHGAKSSR